MGLCALCLGGPAERQLPGYGLPACQICWNQAQEGWPEAYEPTLRKALATKGLLIPDRNERGRYPRHYSPPADHAL